jgi:hypothetical protein
MIDNIVTQKKRGRKPKIKIQDTKINENKIEENKIIENIIRTDEEQIIVHLPITLEDVINISNINLSDNKSEEDNIFIKSETDFNKKVVINVTEISNPNIEINNNSILCKNINKINIYNIHFKPGNKCLWCKHSFTTPPIELPEDYYNDIFFCVGNFCSWNCAKSYNIDLNDITIWKRESLLNLMFYKTYNTYKEIISAPSWLLLEDFGGFLSIDEFRNSFILNNKDYLLLHPPLITRQLQIEESYKKSIYNIDNKLENVYNNDLVLKRIKPLNNSSNLEKTMGLKRQLNKN